MKNLRLLNLTSLMIAGLCFFANELGAWERTALDDCKKETKSCTDGRKKECKKDILECKKNALTEDEASFKSHLSPYARSVFMKFTPRQRKQALDYADINKMSPDDAVARAGGVCF